jgi:anti-sigma B factor antagonist
MTRRTRMVAVKQLPAKLDAKTAKRLFRELENILGGDRPALVLDCSAIHELDSTAMHLLLSSLECAMQRNGDVRLSAVGSRARLNMVLAGVDRLFRIFPTSQDAVESFERPAMVYRSVGEMQLAGEAAA